MDVMTNSLTLARENDLDIVFVQVGAFMETHGLAASTLNSRLGLQLWHRNGTPTVGVPVEAIDKWITKVVRLGLSVGVAFERTVDGHLVRRLEHTQRPGVWVSFFSETGDKEHLGPEAGSNHHLGLNQIFAIDSVGLFAPTRVFRRICSNDNCGHDSAFVKCIPSLSAGASQYLDQPIGSAIAAIYPEAS